MFRKDLLKLLRTGHFTVVALARHFGVSPKEIEEDLSHLARSLKHSTDRLMIEPARCRKCGFTFKQDKLAKPGKCPRCHGTWIDPPEVTLVERQ